jgi:1-phosphofructokinase
MGVVRVDDDIPAGPRVCVLAVTPQLTVTIEPGADGRTEVHLHAGGQGLWLARMARSLGAEVVVCGPFGGEAGDVVEHLARMERLEVRAVPNPAGNGVYVHDRRPGERTELARMEPVALGRHAVDDLYGTVLVEALDADVVAIAGGEPAGTVPAGFFARLAEDLRSSGRQVVADLSGEAARAVIGPGVDVLKMSHTEMLGAGLADGDGMGDLLAGARRLLVGGVSAVVVSREAEPTILVSDDVAVEVRAPRVTTVDPRGAGDSMSAGIAVGLGRGMSLAEAVRLGAAAGALNVTRRGLGTGRREQIERFAREVTIAEIGTGWEGRWRSASADHQR